MIYNVGMVSLGCAKNLVDTEMMLGILNKEGYQLVSKEEDADILIVNTCGFIESAKQESINTIIKLAEYKKNGKCKTLIVAGCLAERYNEELQKEIPEIDGIIGTGNFTEILKVINKTLSGEKYINFGNQNSNFKEELPRMLTTASHTAYLKIADGCDHFCTYCIIPYLRGSYRSRKMQNIVNEAKLLSSQGVKEFVIIAQDITEYGKDIYGEIKLIELLKEITKIENVEWIRLLYSYPENISDELIILIKNNKKICNYIDIPIQHINDNILKKMGRNINRQEIINLIKRLRYFIPDIIIRTSLIVGFPGEKNEYFDELLDFIKTIELDHVGVFTYSKEENTPAARLSNQIELEIKEERKSKIMEAQQIISLNKNKRKINKTYKVLIEGKVEKENVYYGRSYALAPDIDGLIYFKTNLSIKKGDYCFVKVIKALEYDLIGEVIDESCK
jgi:ribosomal protein S12 methylthiotransferase